MNRQSGSNPRQWLWFLPAVVFFALVVFMASRIGEDPNRLPSALVGHELPAFTLPVLSGEGEAVTNTELLKTVEGEYFLINVWASWCPSCYQEHPYLMQLSSEIDIVGLNYKDQPNAAREFLLRQGNPFSVVLVDQSGSMGMDLGVTGAPETFLLDDAGKILLRFQGPLSTEVWQQEFVPLMVTHNNALKNAEVKKAGDL